MEGDQKSAGEQRERIGLGKITSNEEVPAGHKLTVTRIGFYLALIVLSYLGVVTVAIFVDYFLHAPACPNSTNPTADDLKNYAELSKLAIERSQKLFEQFLERSMLPVLMAILGYIFGVRGVEREEK